MVDGGNDIGCRCTKEEVGGSSIVRGMNGLVIKSVEAQARVSE